MMVSKWVANARSFRAIVACCSVFGGGLAVAAPPALAHGNEVKNFWIKLTPRGNSVYAQGLTGAGWWGFGGKLLYGYATGSLQEKWVKDGKWHQMISESGAAVKDEEWSWAYPTIKCWGSARREWRLYGTGHYRVIVPYDPAGHIFTDDAYNNPIEATLSCAA